MTALHELCIDALQLRKTTLIETLEEEAALIATVFAKFRGTTIQPIQQRLWPNAF